MLLGDKAAAQAALLAATTEIDKAATKEYITRIMLPARYPAYPRLLIPSLNL